MRNILWWSPVLFILFTGMSCEDVGVPIIEDFTLTHMDNSGKYPIEATKGKAIKKEAYVLKISLKTQSGSDYWYPEDELQDAITRIQILTKNKWDDFYPAQSDIIDCFKGYQISGDPNGKPGSPIYQIIPIPLSNIVYLQNPDLYLALFYVPMAGEHQFEVNIILNNGTILQHITEPVTLY